MKNLKDQDKKQLKIRVKGIVQGVGFRPFVYRIARENNITGYVLNDTEGVLIICEGKPSSLQEFLNSIKHNPPPLAKIQDIKITEHRPKGYKTFSIRKSKDKKTKDTFIPPDTMVCDECLSEFFNPHNRRYHYPFITCTHCGPRFSIINDIPYDRKNTEMKEFPMCKECMSEYLDPVNRRFHTEPNACPTCGPHLFLYNNKRNLLSEKTDEICDFVADYLKRGKIIAIKGVGGYHLSVDATNDNAVSLLRRRKNRPFKPFAIMMKDIKIAKEYFSINEEEERLLISKERPIVLIREKRRLVSSFVAPNIQHIGLMLPYTPFQHLLFSHPDIMALVMTSGNISGEPIISDDEEAFLELSNIADYFVTYNRKITVFSDDSVLFIEGNTPYFIRRSKGFVPLPFIKNRKFPKSILATGGDLKNSFAIGKENKIILSQYLGDLSSPKSEALYKKILSHFRKIFAFSEDVVVSDKHPNYFTTSIAEEISKNGVKWMKVQHHHAHIVSVMENLDIEKPVIGLAFDGTGYGDDGNLWGSEFFVATKKEYHRRAHFDYFPLPGGEKAIHEIWRIGLSLLYSSFEGRVPLRKYKDKKAILELIEKNINSPLTCSIGRLFDGIASILDIENIITTEAEAAQKLENIACSGWQTEYFDIPYSEKMGIKIIDTFELVRKITEMKKKKFRISRIARIFHNSISNVSIKIAREISKETGIKSVVLSGGSFQNRLLLGTIKEDLEKEGFEVYTPLDIPFNDGGIALGQISIGRELIK